MQTIHTATKVQSQPLHALMRAATPFLRIDGAKPQSWRRNVNTLTKSGKPSGSRRAQPNRYEAMFTALDDKTWSRLGEVLYFVSDQSGRLRMVGQSSRRLQDRWRVSPMHSVEDGSHLGRRSLYHTTGWPAIESSFDTEPPPFTVSALFRADLERVCREIGGPLSDALGMPETKLHKLSYHVEVWIRSLSRSGLDLWNKQ